MIPRLRNKRDAADFAILLALGGFSLYYLQDAWRASSHIYNLILVAPLCAGVFSLCLLEFVLQWRRGAKRDTASDVDSVRVADKETEPITAALPAMGLFAAYVLSLQWLGFDVGTALFVGGFLYLHGERRWPWLLGYALVFALAAGLFFSAMLPYPMPMLILPTEY